MTRASPSAGSTACRRSLDQLKKQASSNNGQDVQLRALEREAKAQRDLLESYLAKYREANTRENIEAAPADGRIISRASVSNTPAYPKKLPIVLIATLASLLLTLGAIATGELLSMTAPRRPGAASPEIEREIAPEIVLAAPPEPVRAPAIAPELPAAPTVEPVDIPDPELIEPRDRCPTNGFRAGNQRSRASRGYAGWRGSRGAQGDRAGHGIEREHHADRTDAGAADGAAGESRGRRSRSILADD